MLKEPSKVVWGSGHVHTSFAVFVGLGAAMNIVEIAHFILDFL